MRRFANELCNTAKIDRLFGGIEDLRLTHRVPVPSINLDTGIRLGIQRIPVARHNADIKLIAQMIDKISNRPNWPARAIAREVIGDEAEDDRPRWSGFRHGKKTRGYRALLGARGWFQANPRRNRLFATNGDMV